MTLDPHTLPANLDLLENIDKATLRLGVQAIDNFRSEVATIFVQESDLVQDIGEDQTREALDRMGTSIIPLRLFGEMDYKRLDTCSCQSLLLAKPYLWTQKQRNDPL